jgi:hypothetical protein
MWRRVDIVWTNVSDDRIASTFWVEKSASKEPAWAGGKQTQSWLGLLATCSSWFLARGFFYPEDGGNTFPEKSVHIRSTRRHIPAHGILQHSVSFVKFGTHSCRAVSNISKILSIFPWNLAFLLSLQFLSKYIQNMLISILCLPLDILSYFPSSHSLQFVLNFPFYIHVRSLRGVDYIAF